MENRAECQNTVEVKVMELRSQGIRSQRYSSTCFELMWGGHSGRQLEAGSPFPERESNPDLGSESAKS